MGGPVNQWVAPSIRQMGGPVNPTAPLINGWPRQSGGPVNPTVTYPVEARRWGFLTVAIQLGIMRGMETNRRTTESK